MLLLILIIHDEFECAVEFYWVTEWLHETDSLFEFN